MDISLCADPPPILPFRGTPNQSTRFQRLHHVALVLLELRQSSRLSRSFFFIPLAFPTNRSFPLLFPRLGVEADEGNFDGALRHSSTNAIHPISNQFLKISSISKRSFSSKFNLICIKFR